MKCNSKHIALWSNQKKCTIEGRLNYKTTPSSYVNQSVFKERWFRLYKNFLIYFKINEHGTFDTSHPAGMFIMENSSVKVEQRTSTPFAFSITFSDDPDKKHIFSARTEENVSQWVEKLNLCSYEYMRSRLYTLQAHLYAISGTDPLLLVPRNEGAQLWKPSAPFSTAPACSTANGFCCHLHTNNTPFTLTRSNSSGKFYVPLNVKTTARERNKCERSSSVDYTAKPAVFYRSAPNPPAIFNRSAPSPPARKKNAISNMAALSDACQNLNVNGQTAPVRPKRKLSPRLPNANCNEQSMGNGDDLIRF